MLHRGDEDMVFWREQTFDEKVQCFGHIQRERHAFRVVFVSSHFCQLISYFTNHCFGRIGFVIPPASYVAAVLLEEVPDGIANAWCFRPRSAAIV